jgi:hypothetical protein
MAEPVWAMRRTDQEGQWLQQIVRRSEHGSIRVRRTMVIMASASGTPAPAIEGLVAGGRGHRPRSGARVQCACLSDHDSRLTCGALLLDLAWAAYRVGIIAE